MNQTVIRVVPINATLWDEQTESHQIQEDDSDGIDPQYDYMLDNLEIESDLVVAEI